MKRRFLRLAIAAAAAIAAASYLTYGYLPRERPGTPSPSALALLASATDGVAAWVPFPHQNLARLERRTGELGTWLGAALGREAARAPRLPRFGPFPVPPARELVVVARADGGVRAELAADPLVAAMARTAGWLARNPWLAGGEVELDRTRRGRVRWQGTTWQLEGGPAPGPPAASGPPAAPGAPVPAGARLGLVRLGAPIPPLPAGLYEVGRDASSGEIRIVAGTPPPAIPAALSGPASSEAPAGWWAERAPEGAARALVVWDVDGDVPGFPALAALDRGGARPFRLPTEPLARLVGRDLAQAESAGFRIRALEQETVARSAPLARALAAGFGGEPGGAQPLAALASVRPERLARRARAIGRALEAVPLVGAERARPFARLAAALAPLNGCARATLEIGAGGAYVRCAPCSGRVLSGGRSD